MDTEELQRAAEHFMAEPYLTGFLEFLGYFNELRDERNSAQSALDDLSIRHTALMQQNSALAAENEVLTAQNSAMNGEIYMLKNSSAPLKDHKVAEIINSVTEVARHYCRTQQLRERIAGILRPVLCGSIDRCPSHESEQGEDDNCGCASCEEGFPCTFAQQKAEKL